MVEQQGTMDAKAAQAVKADQQHNTHCVAIQH